MARRGLTEAGKGSQRRLSKNGRRRRQVVQAVLVPQNMVGSGSSDAASEFDFLRRALRRWWLVALISGVTVAVGTSAAVLHFFTPQYQASAWIEIANQPARIMSEGDRVAGDPEEYVETQIELMRSPLVVGPVAETLAIKALPEIQQMENPTDEIAEAINVQRVGQSELYAVSYTSEDPEVAALLANTIVDEYFRLHNRHNADRALRVIHLLDDEKKHRGEQIQQLRQQMQDLSRELLGIDPFTQTPLGDEPFKSHPFTELLAELSATEVSTKVLEMEVKAFVETATENQGLPAAVLDMALQSDSGVQMAQTELRRKEAVLSETEAVAVGGRSNPQYQRMAREVQQAEHSLAQARQRAREKVEREMGTMFQLEREHQLEELQALLKTRQNTLDILRTRYEAQVKELSHSTERSLELEFVRAELAREEKVFEMIAEHLITLRTEMRAPGRILPVKPAEVPELPVEQFPFRNLAAAIFMSLTLPMGLCLLWELRVRRITESRQLEQQTEVPFVAEVARLPWRRRRVGLLEKRRGRAQEVFQESIDTLRNYLLLSAEGRGIHVLAIVSAVSGEGKTSIASRLAASIARSGGQPVLLIDGDMRAPDIHRIFRLPLEPGLANVLDGTCPMEEAVVPSSVENLHVLPAGQLYSSLHKVLGTDHLPKLIEQLQPHYRCIIIDTPPLLAASESLVMATSADAVLLSAMRGRSREPRIQLVLERLQAAGVRTVGAVLNAVPTRRYSSTYGTYASRSHALHS